MWISYSYWYEYLYSEYYWQSYGNWLLAKHISRYNWPDDGRPHSDSRRPARCQQEMSNMSDECIIIIIIIVVVVIVIIIISSSSESKSSSK